MSWRGPVVPLPMADQVPLGFSEVSQRLLRNEMNIFSSFSVARSYRLPARLEFIRLAAEWKRDTYWDSSVTIKILHPSYQRIIGMGAVAVPWLLEALRAEPDFWFDALTAITGEQPVLFEHAGDMESMANDWLAWGRGHGYEC
jgi:hypothetical protein